MNRTYTLFDFFQKKTRPLFLLILLGFFVFSAGNSYVAAQTQIASLSWGLPDGGWENSVNRIGTPLQFPSTMVRMGDAGYLLIRIMLENDPANNAPWQQPRIKIDLPRGFDFSLTNVTTAARADSILIVEPGLTLRSLFTANTAPTGNAATGSPTNRTITLAYANGAGVNSKGITGTGVPANTLALGDSIVIKVRIRAIWEANPLNPGMVVVTLSSGANQSMMGIPIRQLQLNMTSPTLRIRPTPPYSETVLFDKILVDTNWVHVDIDAQQGHTRSAYINYAYNGTVVYLDSFKIDGKPLTILGSNGGAGVFHENRTSTTARVHIRLDQSNLLGNITDVPRTITFRATSNRGCKWELTPWIQNPLVPNTAPSGTASYDRWNTNVTILDLPGTRGFPLYNSQNNAITGANVGVFTNNSQPIIMRTTPRFNMDKLDDPTDLTNIRTPADAYTANHFYSFCWDGVTPNYATLALKEQNGQPSITCEFRTYLDYYTDLSWCEYYDTTQIYYRVTCPSKLNPAVDSIVVPVTRLLASDLDYYKRPCIEVQNNYPSSNAVTKEHYDPILWDKTRWLALRVPGFGMDNPIPGGAIVEFQWVIYGNPEWINDSYRSRSNFEIYNSSYNYISQSWNTPRYESLCGDINQSGGSNVNPSINRPRFRSAAMPRMAVYSQKSFYWSNPINTGSCNTTANNTPANDITGPRYAEFFVRMPPWLDLDIKTTIEETFRIRHRDSVTFYGSNMPTNGTYHGEDADGYKTYSVVYNTTSGDVVMDIRLIPGECPEEVVILDTLQVWVDWVLGSGEDNSKPDCRPRFKKTSKVWTELEFICTPPALAIDTFGVYRITRGWRDSNNDHVPDDGTLALDNEMDHRHFMEGDTGYFFFKGYVGGSSSQRYDKLVLVLKYGTGGSIGATLQYKWGTTGHTIPFWDQGTIDIKRWNVEKDDFDIYTLPLSIATVTNQDSIIVYYDGGVNDYIPRGGDSCYLKVPFRCRLGSNGNIRGNFYCLTYGIKQNDPTQEWVNKFFPDGLYRIVHHNFALHQNGTGTFNFPIPCIPQQVNDIYTRTYHGGDEISDWPREVRYRHRVDKIVLRMPCGFSRTNDKIYLRPWMWYNVFVPDAYNLEVVPDLAEEDFLTQDSIFTIDMTKYIDATYNGGQDDITNNTTTGALSNGKYTPGDDVGGAYVTFKNIFATPASIRSALTCTMYYTNSIGQPVGTGTGNNSQSVNTNTKTLNYSGRKLQMELQTSVIMYSQMAFTSLKITNANTLLTNEDTWLFVKGNVYDAFLINQVNRTDTIWGEGVDNCWLKIGTMAGGEFRNYDLIYSYKGKDVCENDTVTVYSAFNAEIDNLSAPGFSVDTDYGIEQVTMCNRGERKSTILDLMTARIKVAGYITPDIPNPRKEGYIHFKEDYAMDYTINGKVSQGALNDASVTFRIPVGQIYMDTSKYGVATFEYPQGSGFRPMPQIMLDSLMKELGEGSDYETARDFTIHIKDLLEKEVFMMPGWGWTPFEFTDDERLFTIRIPLVPLCETDLTGMRFRGIFNGKTFCSAPCEDDGTVFLTESILPDVSPEYGFYVKITHTNDSRVFSYEQRTDTIIVTFQKNKGVGSAEIDEDKDYIILRMSDNLTISDDIICTPFGPISIEGVSPPYDGEISYKLYLPAEELNLLIDEDPPMDSTVFEYKIPIRFEPNLTTYDCTKPKQILECMVVSEANFDDTAVECDVSPFNIGSDAMSIITLDYDPEIYKICLNMPNPLTFACGGVTPFWFRDSTGTGGQLMEGNTFIYTPTVYKDTSFWLRIIYDLDGPSGGENMGLTYFKVFMHPLVTADFSIPTVCVGDETTFINNSLVGGVSSHDIITAPTSDAINTKKWYWYLNGATVPFDSVREPTIALKAGDVVKLKVISVDGCEHEKSVTASLYPIPVPAITGSNDNCYRDCIVYKTTPGMTDYEWTVVNGTPKTPLTGRDSVEVCWDLDHTPEPGFIDVVYTDGNGCRAIPKVGDARMRVAIRIPPPAPILSGEEEPCLFSEYTYTCDFDGVIDYFWWTVLGGEVIAGGDAISGPGFGSPFVTVRWLTPGKHTISLEIANRAGCLGQGPGEITVDVLHVDRPEIDGKKELCLDLVEATYTTEPDMRNYVWYINGGTINTGAGTDEVSVLWNTPGTGKLAVRYIIDNDCPAVMVDTFEVTLHPLPTPTVLSGSHDICHLDCDVYTTQTGKDDYIWTVTNGTIDGDNNLDEVKVCWDINFGMLTNDTGYLRIQYTDNHNCTNIKEDTIIIRAKPVAPTILGMANPCTNTFTPYTYTTLTGMQNYSWYVEDGEFVGSTTGNQVSVNWHQAGKGVLAVSYENSYGCLSYDMMDTDTLKITADYCTLIDCDVTTKTGVEDSCYVGYYTHLYDSWDITSLDEPFDSVKYMIGDTLTISGTGATLEDVTFNVGTSQVVCVAYYRNITDTCRFDVTVSKAGVSAIASQITAEDDTICIGSKSTLRATTSIVDPTFLWYETQTSDDVLYEGANYETVTLIRDTVFYVSVYGVGHCENLINTRKEVKIHIDQLSVAGDLSTLAPVVCYEVTDAIITVDDYVGTHIQWQDSTDGVSAKTISPVLELPSGEELNAGTLQQTTWFRAIVTNGVCPSVFGDTIRITVDATSDAGTASNDTTICYNTGATLYIEDYVGTDIQWQDSIAIVGRTWANIAGKDGDELITGNLTETTWFRALVTNGVCDPDISREIKVTVDPLSVAGITSNDTTICKNTSATISIKDFVGNKIQWQDSIVGGTWANIAGATTAIYPTYSLAETTWFRAIVTNGVCDSIFSAEIKVTVNEYAVAADIDAGDESICYGTTATLAAALSATAPSTLSTPTPTFRWYASQTAGSYLGEGDTYTTGTLTATTDFFVSVFNSNFCENLAGERQKVTVTVIRVTPTITISTPTPTVCVGGSVTFTSTIKDGGTAPQYQWRRNTIPVPGATLPQYTYIPNDGDIITCTLTSNAACVSGPVTSLGVTLTVLSYPLAPTVITETLDAYPSSPVDLMGGVVDPIPEMTYNFYENADKSGPITGSIIIYDPSKDDYYVAASNGYCEGPVSQIILKVPCPETTTDSEGNVYKVTALGGLCWTDNIRSTVYSSTGAPIPVFSSYTCKGCPPGLDATFGFLYDWYSTVGGDIGDEEVQGICPDGYHIPSNVEWSKLERYDASKLMSTDYWLDPPGSGTDDYGFGALPAGWFSGESNKYKDIYGFAGWWSSDDNGSDNAAYNFCITYYCNVITGTVKLKIDEQSVRCVMDKE